MAHRPEVLKNFVPLLWRDHGTGLGRSAHQGARLPDLLLRQRVRVLHGRARRRRARRPASPTTKCARSQTEQDHGFAAAGARRHPVRARADADRPSADDTREALFEHFNDEQVVEITLVAAMANFTNRFNNGLDHPAGGAASGMSILSGIHPIVEALQAPSVRSSAFWWRRARAVRACRRSSISRGGPPCRSASSRAPRSTGWPASPAHQGVVAMGAARKYAELERGGRGRTGRRAGRRGGSAQSRRNHPHRARRGRGVDHHSGAARGQHHGRGGQGRGGRARASAGGARHQHQPHARRPEGARLLDLRPRRARRGAVRPGGLRLAHRVRARRRRQGPARAGAEALRPAGPHPDGGQDLVAERLGGGGSGPVRMEEAQVEAG